MAKIKVAVLAPCPFFIDRGTPIRIKRLASEMAEDFEIHVICFHQGSDGSFPFKIHRTLPIPFQIKRSGANILKVLYDILLLLKATFVLRKEKIKIVDAHLHEGAFIGLLLRWFSGVKVIYNAHGTFVQELVATGAVKKDSVLLRPLSWFEWTVEKNVDAIVAQSLLRRDEFVRKGHPESKVVVVEDVPELDDFWLEEHQIDRELERQLRPNGEKLLIYSGGMEPYQGVDYLIAAFRLLAAQRNEVRLVLFGRPMESYRKLVADAGLTSRVVFVEHEPFERLPQYLKICDLGFALRLYGENVPGKLPIYMASGIAVVGTDLKGINTVIAEGNTGFLVPPDDVPRLARRISELLDEPELLRQVGLRGRMEALRRYSREDVRRELGQLYRRLAGVER